METVGSIGVLLTGNATPLEGAVSVAKKAVASLADGMANVNHSLAGLQNLTSGLISGAIGLGVAGAVRAWMPLEEKIAGLGALVRDSGVVEEIEKTSQALQDFAGTDEVRTLKMAETLKMMGTANKDLNNTLVMVQGMQMAAGGMMGERQAFRMLQMYQNGSSIMFERYIPALKQARNEEEKGALIREWIAKGFAKTSAEMDSTHGQMKRMHGASADIKEEFGKLFVAVLQLDRVFGAIASSLKMMRDWFANTTPAVRGWIAGIILAAAAVGPLLLIIRVLIPLLWSLARTLLTALLPAVVAVSAAFLGWTLGKTLGEVKIGMSTIDQYMKQLSMSILSGWTWLWDLLPLYVERAMSKMFAVIAGFTGEDFMKGVLEGQVASITAQIEEINGKRKTAAELNEKWLKDQNELSNKTAITSWSQFADRFTSNSGNLLTTIMDVMSSVGDKIAGGDLFKALFDKHSVTPPDYKLPTFGKNKELEPVKYTEALEKGTAAAYSAQLNQTRHLARIQEASETTADNTTETNNLLMGMMDMLQPAEL